ncbi:transporter [Fulvivirga lutea]|uniref:Transporter n=1 Tax=Fulvivirga lutea TaxID=2810512 RepID=A0A974ZZK5_9BACT|nr:transporter [Fulvivirga lutea]QSE96231.1 transporter [Fulvivirga lutea]
MRILLTLLLCVLFISVQAQETIFTDRPNVTDAVNVLNKGTMQVEVGYLNSTTDFGTSEVTFSTIPNFSFKYGLTDRVELRLLTNYGVLDSPGQDNISGLTPITFSPKFFLIEQDGIIPKASVTTAFTFSDTGEEAFQVEDLNYNFRLLFEYQFNKLTWTNSIGYDFLDNDNSALAYTTVLGYPITDKLGSFVELYGFGESDTSDAAQNLDFGFTYLVSNKLQIDAIYGFNIDDNADSTIFGFGFGYKIN